MSLGRIKLIHLHHWRWATAPELRHFYASTSLKTFAFGIVGVFVPIYLYSLGFGVAQIALFYIIHYSLRFLISLPIAKIINRFGAKHVMATSYILSFIKVLLLVLLAEAHWLFWVIALLDGLDHVSYFIPYHVCLSKLKDQQSAGSQLSRLYQWHELAAAVSPIIGGLIAYQFGIVYALVVTAVLIGASVIPLTLGPEPIGRRQQVKLSELPWHKIKADMVGMFGLSFNQLSTQGVWALFLGLYIFSQGAYLGLGIFASVGLVAGIVVARLYGKLIDLHKGRQLLRTATFFQSISHLFRLLLATPQLAYAFNFLAQPAALGVGLPYSQGMAVRGDELSSHRIVYMAVMEMVNYSAKVLAWLIVFIIASGGYEKLSLQTIFAISILATWLVYSERFKSLRAVKAS